MTNYRASRASITREQAADILSLVREYAQAEYDVARATSTHAHLSAMTRARAGIEALIGYVAMLAGTDAETLTGGRRLRPPV